MVIDTFNWFIAHEIPLSKIFGGQVVNNLNQGFKNYPNLFHVKIYRKNFVLEEALRWSPPVRVLKLNVDGVT